LGCETEQEIYRSRGRGRLTLTQYKTWQQPFIVPDERYNRINLTCPICHHPFGVKVFSKSKARLRKLCVASCFLIIAACAILFGVLAHGEKGFMGYSLAVPFICFTVWQLSDVIRGRLDASDVVFHMGGKVHKVFDGGKEFRKAIEAPCSKPQGIFDRKER
jgi:hypothetical protein